MIDPALLPGDSLWRQTNRLLRLHTPLGEDVLLAEGFEAVECLGPVDEHAGFRIELTALSADATIDLAALLGQAVRVDLLTSLSRSWRRPFHGHCTRVSRLGANGGFTRYRLQIEPWLAFLGQGRDSYIFQDRTVFEIIDELFGDWVGKGRLDPAWRWEIADRSVYPRRSITTQFQESDLAFVRRLLTEEGLFCWFEHEAGEDERLGRHSLVIADHASAFGENMQPEFRYTQPGATLPEDSLDRWCIERQLATGRLAAASWDYRSRGSRPQAERSRVAAAGLAETLVEFDDPGQYAWESPEQGARLLACRQQARDARMLQFEAEGTIRTAAPATRFVLRDHVDAGPVGESREFCIVSVRHRAHNNLGDVRVAAEPPPAGDTSAGTRPLYRNQLVIVPGDLPWRPTLEDDHGRRTHPRPTVRGTLTAVVVGSGAPTHTDRDHRVRVQFPWQRGSRSASGMAHPGDRDNAPASDSLGTWVRVMSPIAGANWGGVFVSRPGQEVVVAFMHGNIDRPVVIGAVYNGQGQRDAAGNRMAGGAMRASANAPAWFAGQHAEAHRHGASLSGFKSQQLSTSRSGQGGYNQLVFDDSPGQARIELGSTQYASRLQLGHLKQQADNARLAERGHGAELTTRAAAALRAGYGLLLSTDARTGAAGTLLDSREAIAQTEQARALVEKLAELAARHGAALAGDPTAAKLSVSEGLGKAIETMAATETRGAPPASSRNIEEEPGTRFIATGGGEGTVPAWSAPRIQYTAPAGIVQVTPADVVLVAGQSMSLAAGQDLNLVAQASQGLAARDGIALFCRGKASHEQKPNAETGIHLHAARGKVLVQAQTGELRAAAEKRVAVTSSEAGIDISAKRNLLATASGASLRIAGGNIELHAPGPVKLKASMKNLTGPQASSSSASLPRVGELKLCEMKSIQAASRSGALVPLS